MKTLSSLFMIVGTVLSGWLTYLLLATSPWASFSAQGSQLMAMAWGRISLVDLYAGFFLGLVFVWIFEPKLWVKILISLTLPTLGNPILAIWLLSRYKFLMKISTVRKIGNR